MQMLIEPNQRVTTVKNQDIKKISADCWKNSESKLKIIKTILETKTVLPITLTQSATSTINRNSNRAERKPKTVYPPCETCGKTNHSIERCYHGANAANRPPPRQRRPERQNQVQERAVQKDSNENSQAVAQNLNWKCHVFTPELQLTDRRQLI